MRHSYNTYMLFLTVFLAVVAGAHADGHVGGGGGASAARSSKNEKTTASGRCVPNSSGCYPMFGVWGSDGDDVYEKRPGEKYRKGDTVYFSELSLIPNEDDYLSEGGVNKLFKRYGVQIFSSEVRLEAKEKDVKGIGIDDKLAWRKVRYYSGKRLNSWADTVNFVFDNFRGLSDKSDLLLNAYETNRLSISRADLLDKVVGMMEIGIPAPDDVNKSPNSNILSMTSFPDMFWYHSFFTAAFKKSLAWNDGTDVFDLQGCRYFDFEDCMKEEVERKVLDLTIYNSGSPGLQRDIAKDPELAYGINSTMHVNTDYPPDGNVIYDAKTLKLLSGTPMSLNPLQGVSYNITGLYKMRPNIIKKESIAAQYLEYLWTDGVRTCDSCMRCVLGQNCDIGPHLDVKRGDIEEDMGGTIHNWTTTTKKGGGSVVTNHQMNYHERVEGSEINEVRERVWNDGKKVIKDTIKLVRIDTLYLFQVTDLPLSDGFQYFDFWGFLGSAAAELLMLENREARQYGYPHYGWWQWESPLDLPYIGQNINGKRELDKNKVDGYITLAVKKELKYVQNMFTNDLKEFMRSPDSVGFDGRVALKKLAEKGFYYVAEDVPGKSLTYLDSGWYFGNAINGYAPYVDATDFIVHNSYYEGDNQFLRLWMKRELSRYDVTRKHEYYMTFKWPLVHRNKDGSVWIVGYAVYNSERPIFEMEGKGGWLEYLSVMGSDFFWEHLYGMGPIIGETYGGSYVEVKNPKTGKKERFYSHEAPILGRKMCHTVYEGIENTVKGSLNDDWQKCYEASMEIKKSADLVYVCPKQKDQKGNYKFPMPLYAREIKTLQSHDKLPLKEGCFLLGNIYLGPEQGGTELYDYFGQFTDTDLPHTNKYLTSVAIETDSLVNDTVDYQKAINRYRLKDYRSDNADPATRAKGFPDNINWTAVWNIVELIAWAEGVNATVKGAYWLATHPADVPMPISFVAACAYKVNEMYENNKVVQTTVKWIKRSWRLYKEFQETLDLVNSAQETYKRIDKTWDGLVTAAQNVRDYYKDFEWEGPWWKVSQLIATREMRKFDASLGRLQGAVSDFGHVCDAMAWQLDTFYVGGAVGLGKEMIDMLTASNLLDVEMDIALASNTQSAIVNSQRDSKSKKRSVTKGQFLSRGTGVVLLYYDNIHIKTMSNGVTALATMLDVFEKEADDWNKYGQYVSDVSSGETWTNIGNNLVDANKDWSNPSVMPIASGLRPPDGLLEQNIKQRVGFVGKYDFWADPKTWNFVEIDDAQIRKAKARESIAKAKRDSTRKAEKIGM